MFQAAWHFLYHQRQSASHWAMSTLGNEQNLSIRRAASPPWRSLYRRKQYHAAVVIASLCSFESISSVSAGIPWVLSPLFYHLYLTCLLVVISLVCPLCSPCSRMVMTCFDCKMKSLSSYWWALTDTFGSAVLISSNRPLLTWLSAAEQNLVYERSCTLLSLEINSESKLMPHFFFYLCKCRLIPQDNIVRKSKSNLPYLQFPNYLTAPGQSF